MAEDKTQTTEEIEKELSVGKFAAQQIRTLAFVAGGTAAGFAAGKWGLTKSKGLVKKVSGWLPGTFKGDEAAAKKTITAASSFIGYVVGQIASLYEHWVKVEREQLSVQEINKDVAGIMEKRVQFEETIENQHKIVKGLLAKHQEAAGQSKGEKILAANEQSASSEPART